MAITKVKTNIPGFDQLIDGGIPQNAAILVSGSPGTGKSIFCLQFLVNGCKEGENVLLLSLEQREKDLLTQASLFGWDIKKYMSEGKFTLLELNLLSDKDVLTELDQTIKEKNITRICVDSLTALQNYPTLIRNVKVMQQIRSFEVEMQVNLLSPETRLRLLIHHLIRFLKSFENTTSLLIADIDYSSNYLSKDGISEFLCDGLLILNAMSVADTLNRTLEVRKMRYTKMQGGIRSCEITDEGFVVE